LQTLADTYADRDVRALVINVLETPASVKTWKEALGWSIPVLADADGSVAEAYAPDVLPELPRNQVPIASNLLIDREGRIRFYELLDSRNFDARLVGLRKVLDELLEEETR